MASDSEEAPVARAVFITLAVVVLYVFSIGPVSRKFPYGFPRESWADTVYYPITWTAKHCEPVDKALNWYFDLWYSPHSRSAPLRPLNPCPSIPPSPPKHTLADAAQMRAQFNGVVDLIQTIPQGPQGVPGVGEDFGRR
jgi:hypothetical protein